MSNEQMMSIAKHIRSLIREFEDEKNCGLYFLDNADQFVIDICGNSDTVLDCAGVILAKIMLETEMTDLDQIMEIVRERTMERFWQFTSEEAQGR